MDGQRACCAAIAHDLLAKARAEAAERRKATQGRPKGSGSKKLTEQIPQVSKPSKRQPEATTKVASQFGTNRKYVEQTERLKAEDPKAFAKVLAGEKTLPTFH